MEEECKRCKLCPQPRLDRRCLFFNLCRGWNLTSLGSSSLPRAREEEEEEEEKGNDWLPILESHACYWEPICSSSLPHRLSTFQTLPSTAGDTFYKVRTCSRSPDSSYLSSGANCPSQELYQKERN